MAVVKFEKNGQGFYDFDALLDVTSVEFVNRVETVIELFEKHDIDFEVKVVLDKVAPTVYLYQEDSIRMFRFYGKGSFGEIALNRWDLEEMLGGFND